MVPCLRDVVGQGSQQGPQIGKMHFVYILFSEPLNSYYVGRTADPENKLIKHLNKHRGFTARAAKCLRAVVHRVPLALDASPAHH